jgi:diphthamide biosynthesis enzyme Dph1/Dph2-like protein
LEKYAFDEMIKRRKNEIQKNSLKDPELHVGVILGILGRQGSPLILERIKESLKEKKIR